MKVGDLVQSTINSTLGVILDLGNRYWDGAQWTFAHVKVSWYPCSGKDNWVLPSRLEVVN
jgi:hypothetical protein